MFWPPRKFKLTTYQNIFFSFFLYKKQKMKPYSFTTCFLVPEKELISWETKKSLEEEGPISHKSIKEEK